MSSEVNEQMKEELEQLRERLQNAETLLEQKEQHYSRLNNDLTAQYRQMFEKSPMPMWVIDTETKKFLDVNERAVYNYGYSREEFLKMTIKDIRPIVDIPKLKTLSWETEGLNSVYRGTWKHFKKNGEAIFVEITSHLIDYNGGKASLVMANDISEKHLNEMQEDFERQFKEALFNSTDDLIWSLDRNYRLVMANSAFLERMQSVTGVALQTGDSLMMEDKYSPQHLAYWEDLYTRGFRGEAFKVDMHSDHEDPAMKVWWDLSLNPLYNDGEVIGISCFARDITQKVNHQYQVLRLNQNLKAAQKIARLGYWDFDLVNNTLYWTDEVYNIWGTSPYYFKLSMDSFRATIHPDDLEKFDIHQQKALSGESDLELEHRIVLQDGSVRYVNERGTVTRDKNGKVIRLEGTVQDITERKKTEEIIRHSEEKSRLIMNAALDAIICIDLSGNITYWNPQAERIFGWKEDEIAGTNVVDLIVPTFYRKWYERGIEVYRNTGTGNMLNTLIELTAIDKSGKEFPIELTVSAIRQGGEDFFCAFIRDISERKKAEEKLFSINEELIERASELATSNAELERFAYVASHDLQEPLRMVTSFLQLIEKKYSPLLDESGRQYIHFAVDGANRMKQLILDLLEYSRVGTKYEITGDTDMNEVVADALQVMNDKIEELNAEIKTEKFPVLPNTRKTQLAQLMQNLISNALKYHSEERPQISIGVKEEPAFWEFCVKDNGIGIDKMFSEKIFILFQRLHSRNEYSGTGIGLAICKKIVEQHDGRIWVESEVGKGSSFYFSIPK